MNTHTTPSRLEHALQARDMALIKLALSMGEAPQAEHLNMAIAGFNGEERMGLCRLLVLRGANPHHGDAPPMIYAQSLGLFDVAWAMQAAFDGQMSSDAS